MVVVRAERFARRHDGAMVPQAMAQMLSARVIAMVVGLVGMAILSRLLTPSDFGFFAVGLAAFTVAQAFAQFGLMEHLVGRTEPTVDEVRSAAGLAGSAAARRPGGTRFRRARSLRGPLRCSLSLPFIGTTHWGGGKHEHGGGPRMNRRCPSPSEERCEGCGVAWW